MMTDEPEAIMPDDPSEETTRAAPVMDQIRKALRGLRFGEVKITVHGGRVVQVDRTERVRFRRPETS